MTVTVRGWKKLELVFVSVVDAQIDEGVLAALSEKHVQMISDDLIDMIELIFPDGQHFRIGTNTAGMVQPVAVDPENPDAALRRWKG